MQINQLKKASPEKWDVDLSLSNLFTTAFKLVKPFLVPAAKMPTKALGTMRPSFSTEKLLKKVFRSNISL